MLLLLLPNGNVKITGLDLEPEQFKSEYSVTDDELKQVRAICCIVVICSECRVHAGAFDIFVC